MNQYDRDRGHESRTEQLLSEIDAAVNNPLSLREYKQIFDTNTDPDHGSITCMNRRELTLSLRTLQEHIQINDELISKTLGDFEAQMTSAQHSKAGYGDGISFKNTLFVVQTPKGLGFSSLFTTSFERNKDKEQPLSEAFEAARKSAPQKSEYEKAGPEEKVFAKGRISLANLEELKAMVLIARDKGQNSSLDQIISAISNVREFHNAARVVYETYGDKVQYGAFMQLLKAGSKIYCLVGWEVRLPPNTPQPPEESEQNTISAEQAHQMLAEIMTKRVSSEQFQNLPYDQKVTIPAQVQVKTSADLRTLLETLTDFPEYQYLKNPAQWQRALEILEHEKEHYVDAQKIQYAIGLENDMKIGFGLKLLSGGMFVPVVNISFLDAVPEEMRRAIIKMVSVAPTNVSDLDIEQFHDM